MEHRTIRRSLDKLGMTTESQCHFVACALSEENKNTMRENRRKLFFGKKTVRGFSFGEVILSVFVVSVGLVAILNLFVQNYSEAVLDRDRIVAAQLAQEGVELVRNVRDNNFFSGNGFQAGGFSSDRHCRISYSEASITCYANTVDPERKFSLLVSGMYYVHMDMDTAQKFSRYININYRSSGPGSPYADVVSVVYWNSLWTGNITTLNGAFVNGVNVDLASCTPGNKCVYSRAKIEGWK